MNNMEQFNLQKYLDNPNRKVVTRKGDNVRIICTNRICTYLDEDYPVVGLVRNRFDGSEMVAGFKSNGESKDKNWDLFFDPEQKVCPFKKGDRVLVRDSDTHWKFDVFQSYEEGERHPYIGMDDIYEQCIPLNRNTWRLLGTTDEYKEEE